jgi:hypothetical protein
VAGDQGDDVLSLGHHLPQPQDPGRVAILAHPAEAALDRRVVEGDQGRPLGLLLEPGAQPGGAGLAEAAAVAPLLQRVEDEDPDRPLLDRILDEAVGGLGLREPAQEILAAVVVAEREADREGQVDERVAKACVGDSVEAVLDEVAGGEQQVRARRHPHQRFQHRVEPATVGLARIVAVEAEMHVGDLRDQHQPPPSSRATLCRLSAPMRCRMIIAGAPSSRW